MALISQFSVHTAMFRSLASAHNSFLKSFSRSSFVLPNSCSSVSESVAHYHSCGSQKRSGKKELSLFCNNSVLAASNQYGSQFCAQKCMFHSSAPHPGAEDSKRGFSFQIPNLFKLMSHWLVLREFRTSWDPDFDVQEFKLGVCQAVVRVTELVQAREWGELKGLLRQSIIDDFRLMRGPYNQDIVHVMPLSLGDIEFVHIDGIRLQQVVDEKYCDFAVVVYAFKPEPDFKRDTYLTIGLRFHRNYTRGALPSWTIHRLFVEIESLDWTC